MEKSGMLKLVVEIEVGDMTADDVDKLTYSSDVMKSRQYVSQAPSSSNLSISYPLNDIPSTVNHNAYMASSLIPQIDYAPTVHQHSKLQPPKTGLVVLVF
nr:hypothetical protein [Tanacetum cinerariifolium]